MILSLMFKDMLQHLLCTGSFSHLIGPKRRDRLGGLLICIVSVCMNLIDNSSAICELLISDIGPILTQQSS